MGQRGAKAAFMPDKFVFPGGALDPEDAQVSFARPLDPLSAARLNQNSAPGLGPALAAAAIRELWEETGLALGQPGQWDTTPPENWASYAARGYVPVASPLSFVFRAITPPGRPRRFDARFFLADASGIANDLDDFSGAQDELSHLQWIPLTKAQEFNLPFITEVALSEITRILSAPLPPDRVPFFDNTTDRAQFRWLT